MADRPTRKEVTLRREWPPIDISEKPESRREHGQMALLMVLVTAGLLLQSSIPLEFAVVTAFIAGYAFNNWLLFEDAYEEVGE